jgi:hypothetical protein
MIKIVIAIALACTGMNAQVAGGPSTSAEPANLVARWNRNVLAGRLFTLSNVTFADRASGLYDAKHTYESSHPFTAIPAGHTNKNPNTVPNPYCVLNGNIRGDARYPGAYAVIELFHSRSGLTNLFRRIP